jgi:hypothetical protein
VRREFWTIKIQRENVVLTDGPSILFMTKILNNANPQNIKNSSRIAQFRKEFIPSFAITAAFTLKTTKITNNKSVQLA